MSKYSAPRGLAPVSDALPDFHRLVELHLGLVEPIALSIWRKLPKGLIDPEDVVQAGMLGLIDAARRFEQGKGKIPFEFYARMRIRGAIIDSIRCEPFPGWVSNRREFPVGIPSQESEPDLPGRRQLRMQNALAAAVEGLSEQEQDVIELRYFDGQSPQQIADSKVLNIGKSQVQKLTRSALKKLREGLRNAA